MGELNGLDLNNKATAIENILNFIAYCHAGLRNRNVSFRSTRHVERPPCGRKVLKAGKSKSGSTPQVSKTELLISVSIVALGKWRAPTSLEETFELTEKTLDSVNGNGVYTVTGNRLSISQPPMKDNIRLYSFPN